MENSDKKKMFSLLENIDKTFIFENADVDNMEKRINTDSIQKNLNSKINNAYEFKDAFIAWFETLGLTPENINLGRIKSDIDSALRLKGYN